MHLDVCYLSVCWYVWIGLSPWCNLFCMSHVHAFPMHTYLLFNIFDIIDVAWDFFYFSFLFLPLFLFTLVVSMIPKRKSTPAWDLLRSGASSSSDPSPSNVQFCDDDAFKAFLENFSRWGIHSERQVVLLDFANTDLPSIIHSRGWESLCDVLVTYPLVLIQDFYSNMHGIDRLVPFFFTRILVTLQLVADGFRVPRIEFPDYLSCERLRTVSRDELMSTFCERPAT